MGKERWGLVRMKKVWKKTVPELMKKGQRLLMSLMHTNYFKQ